MIKALIPCLIFTVVNSVSAADEANDEIRRGRYLSLIGGCNDCHTSGFAPSEGKVPESEWLKGDSVGWRGPWGTTYPINLRNLVASLSREQWISLMRNSKARPPMPAYVTRTMPEADLGALYAFIKSLGSGGATVPAALPPGVEPVTPFINFQVISKSELGK